VLPNIPNQTRNLSLVYLQEYEFWPLSRQHVYNSISSQSVTCSIVTAQAQTSYSNTNVAKETEMASAQNVAKGAKLHGHSLIHNL
jgi:hypothetical protein